MGELRFHVNGRPVDATGQAPTTTLLDFLRRELRLTGTKEGCKEGDCGACTVAVLDDAGHFRAVNACLVLLPMVQGRQVITVEGLADGATPHPVQEALVRHLGSQCGYCTPGVILSMFEAAYRDDVKEAWQRDDQLCGNLCRCTGYRPIRDAVEETAGKAGEDRFRALARSAGPAEVALDYALGAQRWVTPKTLPELFAALPGARLVAGGTDLSLEVTKRHVAHASLVSVEGVPELRSCTTTADGGLRIGAAVTLSELHDGPARAIPALDKMLRVFASRQIKNRATIGGNLCNASPIGDLAPVLLALDATAVIASAAGERRVPLHEFFLGYRKTALGPAELLAAVELPRARPGSFSRSYKVSRRRELDISAVALGASVRVEAGLARDVRLGFGGVAATPIRARKTEAALEGKPFSRANVEAALAVLDAELHPIDDHRGSAGYRRRLARNLLLGFLLEHEAGAATLQARPTATIELTWPEAP